jgi:predicted enzyme related to lactoylglutathione lyase
MFTGIKSVIYPSSDLEKDKKYWEAVLGVKPYFDQPYYVGFSTDECELGLDPNAVKEGLTYPVAYWHVEDVTEAARQLIDQGAVTHSEVRDVGGGMMLGTFKDPSGNIFGIIDSPNAE